MHPFYASLFSIIILVSAHSSFCAGEINHIPIKKSYWPTLQTLPALTADNVSRGLSLIGALACLTMCMRIGHYVYIRFFATARPQPTLAEWIAKLEQQSHPSLTIKPEIQRAAHNFIMTEYHNKTPQHITKPPKSVTDNNPFYRLAPLLQHKTEFTGATDQAYSIIIEDPTPTEGSQRFDFTVHRGHCIRVMILNYEAGNYRSQLCYPPNESDAEEGTLWLQNANALMHAQQRYDIVQNQW